MENFELDQAFGIVELEPRQATSPDAQIGIGISVGSGGSGSGSSGSGSVGSGGSGT